MASGSAYQPSKTGLPDCCWPETPKMKMIKKTNSATVCFIIEIFVVSEVKNFSHNEFTLAGQLVNTMNNFSLPLLANMELIEQTFTRSGEFLNKEKIISSIY
jgi:hypothetical protein